ncbi:MAG: DUF6326 family protein [Polyangiaceae bacterium]
MTTSATKATDMKMVLSTLWVFAMFNYLYADVMGLMDASLLKQFLSGEVGGLKVSQSFLLSAALLMEIPIAMVLLSRLLAYRANRWANIVSGVIKTVAVLASLFVGKPTLYYLFFSSIEVACTSVIVYLAWQWKPAPR